MSGTIELVSKEAKRLVYAYPERTKKEKIKYSIKRVLRPHATPKTKRFSWPQAMLTLGLWEVGERGIVENYYQKMVEKGCLIETIETCMHGQVLLSLWKSCEDQKLKTQYQNAIDKMYRYLLEQYQKYDNTIPYNENHPTYILVDGIGMGVPFLAGYGSVLGEQKATQMAVDLLEEYWKFGLDSVTGLPYHGYDSRSKMKYGIIGWGRAVGWLLWGIVDSLEYLPEEIRSIWQERAGQLVKNCMTYQRADGGFSWQLQALGGHVDSSTMAMLGAGLRKLLDRMDSDEVVSTESEIIQQNHKDLQNCFERLVLALESCRKEGKVMESSAECIDFAQYPQVYGSYPWSVGPYLRIKEKVYDNHQS